MITFGLNTDGRGDPVAEARRAEALGFDTFGIGEHVFFHYPTTNALISLAAAASATERIGLLAAVTLLPLYPPALLAKMATTLDVVSHGRFQLGVGVGGEYPAEFDACGVPVGERGARADESLTVLRALWSGQPVDFEGPHASIRRLTLAPQPVQAGGPPIWVAGRSEAALRRAVRFGDGWMPYFRSPRSLARDVATLREIAEAGGRDPMGVRVGAVVFACVHDDRDRALSMISERLAANYAGDYSAVIEHQAAAGPPERCRARVEEYIDAGADTIFFATLAHPDHQGESEERLARQVVDPLRVTRRS